MFCEGVTDVCGLVFHGFFGQNDSFYVLGYACVMSQTLYVLLCIQILAEICLVKIYCLPVEQTNSREKMSIIHKNIQTKLTKSFLDLIVLQMLDNRPMHGYEILVTIRKTYGISFGVSTIYPLLNTMEKKNYIKCDWNLNGGRPKKVYALTTDGKDLLDYTAGSLKAICRTLGNEVTTTRGDHLHLMIAHVPKR